MPTSAGMTSFNAMRRRMTEPCNAGAGLGDSAAQGMPSVLSGRPAPATVPAPGRQSETTSAAERVPASAAPDYTPTPARRSFAMSLPCRLLIVICSLLIATAALAEQPPPATEPAAPAPHLIDRFKALEGLWSAEGLEGNSAPDTKVRYEVTAGGSAVMETLFAGTPHEMRTLYTREGDDLVLIHYCASGNHPRMRAKALEGDRLAFAFDGALNFDPKVDGHMHDAEFRFIASDEISTRWNFWKNGAPGDHVAHLHLRRVVEQP